MQPTPNVTVRLEPVLPGRGDFDRVAGTRAVYLARVDLHAGVVSTALLDATPLAAEREGNDSGVKGSQVQILSARPIHRL